MKKVIGGLAVFVLVFAASVSAVGDKTKVGMLKSGFYHFHDVTDEFGFGLGNIGKLDCTVSAEQQAPYGTNRIVDCDGEVPHNEITIAVDPLDPNHAVGAYHSYQVVATGGKQHLHVVGTPSVSFNGGRTWREVGTPLTPYQFTGDPALTFDASGKLYFSNIADHEGQGGANYTGPSVVVASSTNGGLTWSKPVTVASGGGNAGSNGGDIFNDKDYIAADTNATGSPYKNRVYLTWTRFEEKFTGAKPFIRLPVVLSRSDDGVRWAAHTEISGFSPACSVRLFGAPNECDLSEFSNPTVAPGGTVYVGFENFNTPAQDQYLVVKSTNGGASFSPPVKAADIFDFDNMPLNADEEPTLTGCQLRWIGPGNIAADPSDATGRTVYVTWADNRAGSVTATDTSVFLARSTDAGDTWTVYTVDNAPNDQFYPWVAVSSTGRVDVGYMDRSYSAGQSVCQYGFSLRRITFPSGVFTPAAKMQASTALSDPGKSRWFSGTTNGSGTFIGDYDGVAIGSDGKTWSLWTDQRADATNALPPNRIKGQHAVAAITP